MFPAIGRMIEPAIDATKTEAPTPNARTRVGTARVVDPNQHVRIIERLEDRAAEQDHARLGGCTNAMAMTMAAIAP